MKNLFLGFFLLTSMCMRAQSVAELTDQFNAKMQEAQTLLNKLKSMAQTPITVMSGLPDGVKFSIDPFQPLMTFDETKPATVGNPSTRVWAAYQPLEKGTGNAPFYINQSVTKYPGITMGDEVFMLGWNLSPGGGAVIPGQPGVGLSFEQQYKPNHNGLGLTEHHGFWINPKDGKQIRIFSYTINNETADIDLYQTANRIYQKSVDGSVWHGLNRGTQNEIVEYYAGPGYNITWNYDFQGLQINSGGLPVYFRDVRFVQLPGALFHTKYMSFDNQAEFNGPVKFTGPVTFENGFVNKKP